MKKTVVIDQTKYAQTIAIAEACGVDVKMCPVHRSRVCCGRGYPDYFNDLNAMALARKVLTIPQRRNFTIELGYTIGNTGIDTFDLIDANAAMQAEAFLRAIGAWKR